MNPKIEEQIQQTLQAFDNDNVEIRPKLYSRIQKKRFYQETTYSSSLAIRYTFYICFCFLSMFSGLKVGLSISEETTDGFALFEQNYKLLNSSIETNVLEYEWIPSEKMK